MQEELISVIVPVYNVEHYLRNCVDSILNQTYKNLHVILVDDGSTDDSGAICDEYALKDARVDVFHQQNSGPSVARNCGLENAKGEYIGFIDSDDIIHPQMYEALRDALVTNPDCAFAGCMFSFVDKYQSFDDIPKEEPLIVEKEVLVSSPFVWQGRIRTAASSLLNKLYRRECIGDIRFSGKKYAEDYEFNVQIYLGASKAVFLKEEYYQHLVLPNSLAHSEKKLQTLDEIEAFEFCYKQIPRADAFGRSRCLDRLVWRSLEVYANTRNLDDNNSINKKIKQIANDYWKDVLFNSDKDILRRLKLTILLVCPHLYLLFNKVNNNN